MSRIYYRGARAAIVCYDLTDCSSFERVKFWVNELQNFEENCRIYICGTKVDLIENDKNRRQVDFHDVQDYADEIKAHLCETSSKTGHSVGKDMFFNSIRVSLCFHQHFIYDTLTACLQGTYTPFLSRPISSFQRCHTLNDNCAVMQHCTHMKVLSFFCDR
ncbi:unnamed protein product [Staurois parvus]|uniref:Ras-related protein Rab-24 n=1 Tax=Staurois parvus TaxID=386267 RepID=A0ABN9G402_9NEOB|nr:unnamed protein product [Staurois parvus]